MSHRKNESDATHFRSRRVMNINGQWFFLVRESGDPMGPFESREGAVRTLNAYVRDIKNGRTITEALYDVRLASDSYHEDRF